MWAHRREGLAIGHRDVNTLVEGRRRDFVRDHTQHTRDIRLNQPISLVPYLKACQGQNFNDSRIERGAKHTFASTRSRTKKRGGASVAHL
jgi:hypothetical protein